MFWTQKLLVSLAFILGATATLVGIYFQEDIKQQFLLWILAWKGIDLGSLPIEISLPSA